MGKLLYKSFQYVYIGCVGGRYGINERKVGDSVNFSRHSLEQNRVFSHKDVFQSAVPKCGGVLNDGSDKIWCCVGGCASSCHLLMMKGVWARKGGVFQREMSFFFGQFPKTTFGDRHGRLWRNRPWIGYSIHFLTLILRQNILLNFTNTTYQNNKALRFQIFKFWHQILSPPSENVPPYLPTTMIHRN